MDISAHPPQANSSGSEAEKRSTVSVLIVEDDTMISDLLSKKLTMCGYTVYHTSEGDKAVSLAQQYLPNVIILDLMLPGMDGEEILKAIKATDEIKHIPVIIFTNKSEAGGKERLLKLGAARYYIKAETDLSDVVEDMGELTRHF